MIQRPQDRFIPKHDITKGAPSCHKCGKEMKLVGENETTWQWGCQPCQFAHVFSKPQSQAAAQHTVMQGRMENHRRMLKAYDSRPKFFLLGGSKQK